jgi:hypothetical protein
VPFWYYGINNHTVTHTRDTRSVSSGICCVHSVTWTNFIPRTFVLPCHYQAISPTYRSFTYHRRNSYTNWRYHYVTLSASVCPFFSPSLLGQFVPQDINEWYKLIASLPVNYRQQELSALSLMKPCTDNETKAKCRGDIWHMIGKFIFRNCRKYTKFLSNICTKPSGEIYFWLTLFRNKFCLTQFPKQILSIFRPVRNFRKATISFVMSVCPYFCPHEIAWLPLDWFSWNLVLGCSPKMWWKNSSSSFIKLGQE